MWSFDEEENKQNDPSPEGGGEEGQDGYEKPGDDFDSRDPFSRGGDFYSSYNGSENGYGSPKKPGRKPLGTLLPALIVCVAVFAGTIFIGSHFGNGNLSVGGKKTTVSTTLPQNTTGSTSLTTGTQATAPAIVPGTSSGIPSVSYVQWDTDIVKRCLNASVLISVEKVGSGSGVIYTQDGYILTNYHVVSNNNNPISVTLFSGEVVSGQYIYGDENNDIAVIKIDKNDCVYADISTDNVTYMMPVMVIGNALGRGFNTTEGVVSAPASEVYFSSTYETMTLIQIDAAVNSGNSGGGLFNTAGQLIGIVNAKLSGTTSSGTTIESMGYAIPMSTVVKCVNDLRNYGYVTGVARLGVTVGNYIQLPNGYRYGAYVVEGLAKGGSAELSGVKKGDILYEINGTKITTFETLKKMLTAYSVGDKVEFTVLRQVKEPTQYTDLREYLNECLEEVTVTLTFVEFNPYQ